ncbi:AQJ64_40280 family protein [Streptomyces sp. NBC_00582]|uniref:AQJ64_40280 family protein n=1 Tax=Streptomyces sp. NBC_00582 TaxID=2975783 RepID=UPI0010642BB9|nr:AQJ64_40280 family protein [Streptomyces sp. NBC_00582]WUB63146.1 amine oxidase [Streptomyces sp. NBC_00582]
MDTTVEWVDVRERLPRSGTPVAAATTGRYPDGEEFWLVLPMHFTTLHFAEDGTEHHDCFVDSDKVVRLPHGRPCDEPVTHWAALPTLPGTTVHHVLGDGVRTALQQARHQDGDGD